MSAVFSGIQGAVLRLGGFKNGVRHVLPGSGVMKTLQWGDEDTAVG